MRMKWTLQMKLIKVGLLNKILLIILSIFIISFMIWYRFLRTNIPRDIPFNITLLGFMLLSMLYIAYLITFLLLLNIIQNKTFILTNIINVFYKPLEYLDQEVKQHKKIKPYFEKYCLKFRPILTKYYYFLIVLEIMPRIILIIIFMIDIFAFHKISYTYICIPFLIFLFLAKYIHYTLKNIKEDQMIKCNNKIEIHLTAFTGPIISIEQFVYEQTLRIINNDTLLTYDLLAKYSYLNQVAIDLKLPKGYAINFKSMYATQRNVLNLLSNINVILYKYNLYKENLKWLNIIISLCYIIGWSYILLVSLPKLHFEFWEELFLQNFQDNLEPFSALSLQ